MKKLTQHEIDHCRRSYGNGLQSVAALARSFGVGHTAMRGYVDDGYAEAERLRKQNLRRAANRHVPERHCVRSMAKMDPAVQAERARAMSASQTLTAEYFGDPLPGRSALDHKKQHVTR